MPNKDNRSICNNLYLNSLRGLYAVGPITAIIGHQSQMLRGICEGDHYRVRGISQ